MSVSTLIFIAALVMAWALIKMAPKLFVRQVGRLTLGAIGQDALVKVPDQIQLSLVDDVHWKDSAATSSRHLRWCGLASTTWGRIAWTRWRVLVRIVFHRCRSHYRTP
jgi:hypothetical protein